MVSVLLSKEALVAEYGISLESVAGLRGGAHEMSLAGRLAAMSRCLEPDCPGTMAQSSAHSCAVVSGLCSPSKLGFVLCNGDDGRIYTTRRVVKIQVN